MRDRNGLVPAAGIALGAVLLFLTASLAANLVALRQGKLFPFSWFLFDPADRFADFFKLSLSYPGPAVHAPAAWWHVDWLFARYYRWLDVFADSPFNNRHVPPFETMLALGQRALLTLADPMLVFSLLLAGSFALLCTATTRFVPATERARMIFVTLLGYPALFAMDRGHIYSVLCGALLIAAVARTLVRGEADRWSILLFAVALNFRPNAVLFPGALWLAGRMRFRELLFAGLGSVALLGLSFVVAHHFYPVYTPASLAKGLADYRAAYIGSANGLFYGSSLWGALLMFGVPDPLRTLLPLLVGGAITLVAALLARLEVVRASSFLFLVTSAYALSTTVFADYHLVIFLLPLVFLVREESAGLPRRGEQLGVLVGSVAMLLPKNFMFIPLGEERFLSTQVIINPLLLVQCALLVMILAAGRLRREQLRDLVGSFRRPVAGALQRA
ncbi:hypothetical protein HMF7854_10560 [Sphingomonas ginkgonis]|uniref:DUF2029 domain-containing protein n=1 Tax=Sphingomonas ginkgonis TaxID=2315330 RepID=A0A3R9YJB3_9SPHN|nr:hypothetical protein [Sphingomonas ginkgonis]RST31228.1 hypothetical protein HMF7854_10560 [Sphingomonas ginkgonis]